MLLLLLLLLVGVYAGCDNNCSGHGVCGEKGICKCYDNYGLGIEHLSGDCSERICPYEIAWVDTPDINGYHHRYAECANRGICNRVTGECECFPGKNDIISIIKCTIYVFEHALSSCLLGYEGQACKRSSCPRDCSGHGRCMLIENLPYGEVPEDANILDYSIQNPLTFGDEYHSWDRSKSMGCLCDPGYFDAGNFLIENEIVFYQYFK